MEQQPMGPPAVRQTAADWWRGSGMRRRESWAASLGVRVLELVVPI